MRMRSRVPLTLVCLFASSLLFACGGGSEDGESSGGTDAGSNATADVDGSDADPGESADTSDPGDGSSRAQPFSDECTTTVAPQENTTETTNTLNRTFVMAESGDTICLRDGTYMVERQLNINKSNIEIRGQSQSNTILDFSPQSEGSNGILVQADKNFVGRSFTIRNTNADAIKVKQVDGVVFKDMTVTWSREKSEQNGAYGLYPVESKNVLIDGCKVSGARDAGVYLGQSENAIIRDTEAFGNVVGIEVENTIHAEVYDNYAHDNTAGFLIIALPDLNVKKNTRTLLYDNRANNNNIENFGKSGTTVSRMPPGTGILVMTTDGAEVRDNEVKGNTSVGIGLANHFILDPGCCDDDQYDPYSEGNWIHDNKLSNNGQDPKGLANSIKPSDQETIPQLFWDGVFDENKSDAQNKRNCFGGNTNGNGKTVEMSLIPDAMCAETQHEDSTFCKNDCQHDPTEGVTLPDRIKQEVN